MKAKKMKRVNYYIEQVQAEGLKVLEESTGHTTSELIRRAIDMLIKSEKAREKRNG